VSGHDFEKVVAKVRQRAARGERIVFTNGCFDLLHAGHLRGLRQARGLGDCLVVGVNDDESVHALKGPGRPIVPLAERLELLAAVRWVDEVIPFTGTSPATLLRLLRPRFYAKGADWRQRELPEAPAARESGSEIVFLELLPGLSTTSIVERIRAIPLVEGTDRG